MIYHVVSFEYKNFRHFRSTNNGMIVTSVSRALQSVGPTAQCSLMVEQ